MAYIPIIDPDEATGLLKREYEAALRRAGRIFNIVKVMSQNPKTLQASMRFYLQIMHADSPLSRAQREMLATVVASANNCFY
jgi:alkylhydroperoxidase family enzyme